ncbi:hypothetical protein HMPREF9069_00010 [Atopobium sp. oral taxon 810 str. F0209]|nr:hypothetical protein HMPREF9069_00010 [Atopobium sp. oral taxon 810 str. F0209]
MSFVGAAGFLLRWRALQRGCRSGAAMQLAAASSGAKRSFVANIAM